MRIFCDFDGTISRSDSVDHVLSRLAHPDWLKIEARWEAGKITSSQCMREQIALIEAEPGALEDVLDEVEIDPSFPAFVAWCESRDLSLTVVSDGADLFIQRVMAKAGLGHLPVLANRMRRGPDGWRLDQPFAEARCRPGQGVCKCALVDDYAPAGEAVFIGDGRSDFCVGLRADLVFAKSKLAVHLADQGAPFHPFVSFHDIAAVLSRRMSVQPRTAAVSL